jgi:hypothetical protein
MCVSLFMWYPEIHISSIFFCDGTHANFIVNAVNRYKIRGH